ncbi:hypothetical protein LTR78_004505 [Recurvomyces mirabilis]|uniref:Apple domain-containing protein n=1 Tax=Recurvomyces mirabilis TaxID=574656 RepID=A0AAE0WPA7_9PEZI|nr:hypothetical protein LTR78_004505 [Recurvomyces mirabilis]
MIVPDLTGLSNANDRNDTAPDTTEVIANVSKAKAFGRVGRLIDTTNTKSNSPDRSVQAKNEQLKGLPYKQACASGTAFYACGNGFIGCCAVDPCSPGAAGGCPTQKATITTAVATTSSSSSSSNTSSSQSTGTATGKASTSQATALTTSSATSSGLLTASHTPTSTAVTTSGNPVLGTPIPQCPGANNTLYTDNSKIQYQIHCNADNSRSSDNNITVGTGGYAQCFSACSVSTTCAGFTYVGLDSGNCFLKPAMPNNAYLQKSQSNYISCSKINASAAAPVPGISGTSTPKSSGASNIGVVVGGVVGGVAGLALVLVAIALIARWRRSKVENSRTSEAHIIHGPLESHDMTTMTAGPAYGHGRSGSTAHDAFATYGGYRPGAQADQRAEVCYRRPSNPSSEGLVPDHPPPPPPLPHPVEPHNDGFLPSSVYSQPSNPSTDTLKWLEGTLLKRPVSTSSSAKSPRFYEHLDKSGDAPRPLFHRAGSSEDAPPPTDSPTLGKTPDQSKRAPGSQLADRVRRRQYLASQK